MKTRTITDFLNNDVKEYAVDIIENRCIPSVIDSFKPSQRKVVYVADKIWKTGNEKPIKVFQLTGTTAMESYYHHGNSSMDALITNMGQTFRNNLPILEGIGQYGTLRSPVAGAPRYISTKLSDNFRLLYKDFELLENQIDEGVVVEPKFYLPIIPVIIINSSMGIGMGYSSNILGRNPKDVIQACIDHLNGKKIKELKPWMNEFSGDWVRDKNNPNKWWIKGRYEILSPTMVKVTELPPKWTFESYEKYLDDLIDKRIIRDYDNSSSSGIDYTLKFRREDLDVLIKEGKLEDLLKINGSETENLTTLDENEHLKEFNTAEEIVEYFVNFRLGYYQKRKDYLIDKYTKELGELSWRAKFIKSIIDKKLVVNNTPKDKIVSWLEDNGFEKMNNDYGYLLSMPIWNLTKERYDDLMSKVKMKKELLDETRGLVLKDMYLNDLQELKKKI